jgi:hypothetical protein
MPLSMRWTLLLLVVVSTSASAGDVSVQLDAGAGFSVKNDTGTVERLRIDEATGNLSRNGALFVHTTGTSNLFVGPGAGNLGTSGYGLNSAFGINALSSITTGVYNAAFGYAALSSNTTGSSNSAFGRNALRYNTTGGVNSAFGARALESNTTGSYNSAFGRNAMDFNTTGSYNAAFGRTALRYNTTASNNAAFGTHALRHNITGQSNSALGSDALHNSTTASNNIAVGRDAGINQTTGGNNIYLANEGVAGESGQIKIGTAGSHTQATIAGISGSTSAGGIGVLVNASGVLGTTTSSARFKQDVRDMGGASDVLMRLRPVTFRYTEDAVGAQDAKTPQYGLIAEEVAEVAPELVAPDLDGKPYSVKYHELPALLLNELQEQDRTNAEQQRTIETQERTLSEQRAQIAALSERMEALNAALAGRLP